MQGSASGTGSTGSPDFRDRDSFLHPGLGPRLKFEICGIWDWDGDLNLKNPGLGPGD